MEQLRLEGMPRRLYACTPTRLSAWLDCPRRYRMSYLDRPPPRKGPPWAHNSLGASVHNALAGWWRLRQRARTVTAAGDLLVAGWITEGFADPAQAAEHRDRCRGLVEKYVAGLDPAAEPAGVERTVATRTEIIAVSGRIDRLDDRRTGSGQGELVVVDYKTGRYRPDEADTRTSLALALYALAAGRVLRRPCRRVELHHLPSGTVSTWEHTEESLARHLGRAEDIAAECTTADERYKAAVIADGGSAAGAGGGAPAGGGSAVASGASLGRPAGSRPIAISGPVVDEAFPPRPGPGCSWCDFRAQCPEGSAAAPHRRPWEGLAALARDEAALELA
jgi:RecB family exonuclease